MTQAQITDYQITDYGIEHAQYFQGHGVSFTKWEHSTLGCGDTYAEALNDAMEQAAMEGVHIELTPEDQPANWEGKGPSVIVMHEAACPFVTHEGCKSELYYYVGLRW